jgi:hypothetical protein
MRFFLCLIVSVLLTSCGAVYVEYDYDKHAPFDSYATYNYNFVEEDNLSEFDQKRYVKYSDSLLQSRGLQLAEHPDLWITTTAKSFEASSRNTLGVGVGGGGGYGGVSVGGGIPIGGREEHLELTIDFYDSKTQKYIWQAYAESSRKLNATPPERDAYFLKIVSKVYSKYPPKN